MQIHLIEGPLDGEVIDVPLDELRPSEMIVERRRFDNDQQQYLLTSYLYSALNEQEPMVHKMGFCEVISEIPTYVGLCN